MAETPNPSSIPPLGKWISRGLAVLSILSLLDRETPLKLAEQILLLVDAYQRVAHWLFGWISLWDLKVTPSESSALVLIVVWQAAFARVMAFPAPETPDIFKRGSGVYLVVLPVIIVAAVGSAFLMPEYISIPLLLIYVVWMIIEWARPPSEASRIAIFHRPIARRIRRELYLVCSLVAGFVFLSAILKAWGIG